MSRKKYKQSIITWAFEFGSEFTTEQAIRKIGQMGFDGVEIAIWDVNDYPLERRKKIREELIASKLSLVNLCCNCNSVRRKGEGAERSVYTSPEPNVRQNMLDSLQQTMDLALEWNCHSVSTCFTSEPLPLEVPYWQGWGFLVDFFTKAAQSAQKKGVRLSLEWKPDYILNNVDSVLRLINEVGNSNLGALMDTGHCIYAREHLPVVAEMLGSRLFHVHLSDNYGNYDQELPPGSVHNFAPFLSALDKIEYSGFLSMDIWPKQDPATSARLGKDYVDELMRSLQMTGAIGLET